MLLGGIKLGYQDIFIIGATGKVGRTLVSQIIEKDDLNSYKHRNPTRIVGLCDSKTYLFDPKGLSAKICSEFSLKRQTGQEYSKMGDVVTDVSEKSEKTDHHLVFVDTTASTEVLDLHKRIIKETKFGIVTANKNPITQCDCSTFAMLTQEPSRYGYSCSVMAGASTVGWILRCVDLNDPVRSIRGVFSGTLGYICSGIEAGRPFSDVLTEAVREGYAEPDPRDDLNGFDVARKILTLSRTAGRIVNLKDVKIDPFIPKEYFREENVSSFMDSAKNLDTYFSNRVKKAHDKGNVLRYVAEMSVMSNIPTTKVSLIEVPKNSELGMLSGASNLVSIATEVYNSETVGPYSIGPLAGAGLDITARNIRSDLLDQLSKRIVSK